MTVALSEHHKIFKNIQNIQKYSKIFKNIREYSRILWVLYPSVGYQINPLIHGNNVGNDKIIFH